MYVCVCVSRLLYLATVDGHEGCLPVGNGAAAVGVRVPDRSVLVLCRHMPRSGVTGSCGNSVFSFLK